MKSLTFLLLASFLASACQSTRYLPPIHLTQSEMSKGYSFDIRTHQPQTLGAGKYYYCARTVENHCTIIICHGNKSQSPGLDCNAFVPIPDAIHFTKIQEAEMYDVN